MNGIIAALVLLAMMFALSVGGREFERADSTSYPPHTYINLGTVEDEFYELLRQDPEWFIDWLYENYHILDKKIWVQEEETYIKK